MRGLSGAAFPEAGDATPRAGASAKHAPSTSTHTLRGTTMRTPASRTGATRSRASRPCAIETLEPRTLMAAGDVVVPRPVALDAAEVGTILGQAAAQARAGQVIAVVDREGTLLGVFGRAGGDPAEQAAIADAAVQRARTAAAFQSVQNAFTTRTARFIIQNHFPHPVRNTPGGPLYGVEFSSFPGSDVLLPELRSGLSGDPGGVPLFKDRVPVGGIGVAGDGRDLAPTAELRPVLTTLRGAYGERSVAGVFDGREEKDFDESVALAGSVGFAAPKRIQATHIFIDGLRTPFTRSPRARSVRTGPIDVQNPAGQGALLAAPALGKTDPTPIAGTPRLFNGQVQTGTGPVQGTYRNRVAAGATAPQEATITEANRILTSLEASALYANNEPDPDLAATATLTADDVNEVIGNAVNQAVGIRAGIREPNGVPPQVHVVVVDRDGDVLGVFRMADGTNFSYDVAVQKARTAAFFSDDDHAITTRALGFVSQKFFPPGIEKGLEGPLFQLQDKVNVVVDQRNTPSTADDAVTLGLPNLQGDELPNGITVFPGGVPLYKDGVLVGAVGISGDGVDQDDLIAFGGAAGYRPRDEIRSDRLSAEDLTRHLTARAIELAQDANVPVTPGSGSNTFSFDPDAASRRLARGLREVRLPFVKFPRNPFER